MLTGLMYALLAGLFGAVASSSAKLSLGASYLKELCYTAVRKWTVEEDGLTPGVHTTTCEWVKWPFIYLIYISGSELDSLSLPTDLSVKMFLKCF